MIPALFLFDFHLELERFANPVYLFNIVFLGLGASALCFVSWNFAVKILGAVNTSIYIYMVPVITVVTSVLILHEKIIICYRYTSDSGGAIPVRKQNTIGKKERG